MTDLDAIRARVALYTDPEWRGEDASPLWVDVAYDDAAALLAEVDRLTAEQTTLNEAEWHRGERVGHEMAVARERARIWEAVIRLPTRGRHPTEIKGAVLGIVEPGRLQPHPGGIEQFQDEDR